MFDIALLAERMAEAVCFARFDAQLSSLPIGLLGASTGAAAALLAAARLPQEVAAVVSRGGRPDLAGTALDEVRAATLLIVGGADHGVIELNRAASPRSAARSGWRSFPARPTCSRSRAPSTGSSTLPPRGSARISRRLHPGPTASASPGAPTRTLARHGPRIVHPAPR